MTVSKIWRGSACSIPATNSLTSLLISVVGDTGEVEEDEKGEVGLDGGFVDGEKGCVGRFETQVRTRSSLGLT